MIYEIQSERKFYKYCPILGIQYAPYTGHVNPDYDQNNRRVDFFLKRHILFTAVCLLFFY